MTHPHRLPETIRARVADTAIDRVTRFFNATLDDAFAELFQNARRGEPNAISVSTQPLTHAGMLVTVSDDGCGIEDPSVLLAFGSSGWDTDAARAEDPAGIGVYALSRRGCRVSSRPRAPGDPAPGWRAELTPESFLGKTCAPVALDDAAPWPHGTSVSFVAPETLAVIRAAASAAALHCPIAVSFDGEVLDRRAFLDGAVHVERWNGVAFGVFPNRAGGFSEPDLNFHGRTLRVRLPSVRTLHGGGWSVRADCLPPRLNGRGRLSRSGVECDLELVLPARKEAVETAFLEEMRGAARIAVYRAMRASDLTPALAHEDYARAREAGIDMPTAPACLRPWTPAIADTDDWRDRPAVQPVRPGTLVMAADLEPQDSQTLWRAAESAGIAHRLLEADRALEGYAWYDGLPRVSGVSTRIRRAGADRALDAIRAGAEDSPFAYNPSGDMPARADSIHVDLDIRRAGGAPEAMSLPADLAFAGEGWAWVAQSHPIVARDARLKPHELAAILRAAFFSASDDSGADSYETQLARFEEEAMHIALRLLASDDEARRHTIAEAVWREILWVIPHDREVSITVKDRKVSVEFAPASPEGVAA